MIKTDFSKVERLLLIYPAGIVEDQYDYNALIPLYDEQISLVPEDIEVILLSKSPQPISKFKKLHKNIRQFIFLLNQFGYERPLTLNEV